MKRSMISSLLSILTVALAGVGCAAEPIDVIDTDDAVDRASDEAPASPETAETKEAPADVVALRTPSGSEVRFLPIVAGDSRGVLMVESGEDGTLVLDRLTELAGGAELGSRDVWKALAEPGVELPKALEVTGRELRSDLAQGWARALVEPTQSSLYSFACDNDSFTASTPGGLLSDVFTRLDTNDEQHPSRWSYDCYSDFWDGNCYFDNRQYAATWYGLNHWRGKACGHPFDRVGEETHTLVIGGSYYTIEPQVWFMYKTSNQTWQQAHLAGGGGYDFPIGATTVHWWAFDRTTGSALDWRLAIRQAKAWDQFDVLMSRP